MEHMYTVRVLKKNVERYPDFTNPLRGSIQILQILERECSDIVRIFFFKLPECDRIYIVKITSTFSNLVLVLLDYD